MVRLVTLRNPIGLQSRSYRGLHGPGERGQGEGHTRKCDSGFGMGTDGALVRAHLPTCPGEPQDHWPPAHSPAAALPGPPAPRLPHCPSLKAGPWDPWEAGSGEGLGRGLETELEKGDQLQPARSPPWVEAKGPPRPGERPPSLPPSSSLLSTELMQVPQA